MKNLNQSFKGYNHLKIQKSKLKKQVERDNQSVSQKKRNFQKSLQLWLDSMQKENNQKIQTLIIRFKPVQMSYRNNNLNLVKIQNLLTFIKIYQLLQTLKLSIFSQRNLNHLSDYLVLIIYQPPKLHQSKKQQVKKMLLRLAEV